MDAGPSRWQTFTCLDSPRKGNYVVERLTGNANEHDIHEGPIGLRVKIDCELSRGQVGKWAEARFPQVR